MSTTLIGVWLFWSFSLSAAALPGDWSGDYAPCDQHGELLKKGRLSLGVRLSTSDPHWAAAFVRALDYWATVLDMEWHREDGRNCSIHIFAGNTDLFKSIDAARSQFPGRPSFRGWIAFNPKIELSEDEEYGVAMHELGHLFGLPHNSSARSVMYFIRLDGPLILDCDDLAVLSTRHKLRAAKPGKPVGQAFCKGTDQSFSRSKP